MGSANSTNLKVEFYKWSTSEFPQEYAVIYASIDNEFDTFSIFRLSVNPNKVLCSLADKFCKDSPVRLHTVITTERDSTGHLRFGEVKVVSDGTSKEHRIPQIDAVYYSYDNNYGDKSRVWYQVRKSTIQNIGRAEKFMKTVWEIRYSYSISFITMLECLVKIQCDEIEGLSVKFNGPSKFIPREPPSAFKAFVETEFKGEAYTLFSLRKGNNTVQQFPQAQGLINNIAVHNQGNYNGSIFYNCQFYSPSS